MGCELGRRLLLAGSIGILGAAPAGAGFVETYVANHGGCALFSEKFGREVRSPQPFGRPAAAWDPRDVAELEALGLSCVAGPPPIMPGSPGALFRRAVADFRRATDEAGRLRHVVDGERAVVGHVVVSREQDRARRSQNSADEEDGYGAVTERQERERRQAEAGLADRRAAIETHRQALRAQELQRREQDAASALETARRTQQMVAERVVGERQAEGRARDLVERVRSALPRLNEAASTKAVEEIASLRSEIRTIQNRTAGQLGSDLFALDTDLMDADRAIQRRQAAQARRGSPAGAATSERPGTAPEPSPVDGFIVTVRPGISEFGNLTVGGLRKCLANAPGGRTVTIRQDGHPNRYIIRSESRSDVSWLEFVVVASQGEAHIPEARGYSAEYRNPFQATGWRHTMPAIVRVCAS